MHYLYESHNYIPAPWKNQGEKMQEASRNYKRRSKRINRKIFQIPNGTIGKPMKIREIIMLYF